MNEDDQAQVRNSGGGLRSAEKNRQSTCEFGDKVARLVLNIYETKILKKQEAPNSPQAEQQTVVAGFVLVDHIKDEAYVLSVGVGTKFMRSDHVEVDRTIGAKVHDSHAEILARRALMKFIYSELEKRDKSWLFQEQEQQGRRRILRPEFSLHLYTSSTPCGNSTIRRWATGVSEKPIEVENPDGKQYIWPKIDHPPLHITAREEGQIAASVKRDGGELQDVVDSSTLIFANGTAKPNSGQGCILCCSDKIALWNCLGVQGSILGNLIEPIFLQTIVIGRKFSRPHCNRALCCRLQELNADVHHPTLLCTSVKLNNQVITQKSKALFHQTICSYWSFDCPEKCFHLLGDDGTTIQQQEEEEERRIPSIAPKQFWGRYEALTGKQASVAKNDPQYREVKTQALHILMCMKSPRKKRKRHKVVQ